MNAPSPPYRFPHRFAFRSSDQPAQQRPPGTRQAYRFLFATGAAAVLICGLCFLVARGQEVHPRYPGGGVTAIHWQTTESSEVFSATDSPATVAGVKVLGATGTLLGLLFIAAGLKLKFQPDAPADDQPRQWNFPATALMASTAHRDIAPVRRGSTAGRAGGYRNHHPEAPSRIR